MQVTLNLTETQWQALRDILEQLPKEFESTDAIVQSDYLQTRILDVMRRWEEKHHRTVPLWNIQRSVNASPVLVDEALEKLFTNGTIMFVTNTSTGGRPSSGYRMVKT